MTDPSHMLDHYGYWMLALLATVEDFGIPVPGETALIATAAYAGTTGKMNILLVVLAAAGGGIVGDNIGFALGRWAGAWLLLRYGHYVGLSDARIKVGQYLFQKRGRWVVFIGRFFPIVRGITAFLAGTNRMPWPSFLIANASGAFAWAAFFGFGAWLLGAGAAGARESVQYAIAGVTVLSFVVLSLFLWRHEKRLEKEAEKATPGPLTRKTFRRAGRKRPA